jgi:hypothetical protein
MVFQVDLRHANSWVLQLDQVLQPLNFVLIAMKNEGPGLTRTPSVV